MIASLWVSLLLAMMPAARSGALPSSATGAEALEQLDFGIVPSGSVLTHRFAVPGGDTGYSISEVKVSCGACTTARMDTLQVDPGATGWLSVEFRAPQVAGDKHSTVFLVPSNAEQEAKVFKLRVTSAPLYRVVPATVDFGAVPMGEARQTRVEIQANRPFEEGRAVDDAFASVPQPVGADLRWLPKLDGLDVELLPPDQGGEDPSLVLVFSLSGSRGPGMLRSTLSASLGFARGSTDLGVPSNESSSRPKPTPLRIPVVGSIEPPLTASSTVLGVGRIEPGETGSSRCTLRWREGLTPRPLFARCTDSRVDVALEGDELRVSIPHDGLPGTLRASVEVLAHGEDQVLLTLSVVAVLR